MSSQLEVWYFTNEGKLYEHTENDGYAFMKKGPNARNYYLGTIDEAKINHPGKLAQATPGKIWGKIIYPEDGPFE